MIAIRNLKVLVFLSFVSLELLAATPEDKVRFCSGCHGAAGLSEDSLIPHLAGQKALYISNQLHRFRSGSRPNPAMNAASRELTDEEIEQLANYYAAMAPPVPGDSTPSVRLAPETRPLVFCVRCHGTEGISPNGIWPNLAGQNISYMQQQVEAFSSGARKDDMMRMWGSMVNPEDMANILRYFNQAAPVSR